MDLPKLERGEGSFSYCEIHGSIYIQFQKTIGKTKKRVKVYGNTVEECYNLMNEKERILLTEELTNDAIKKPKANAGLPKLPRGQGSFSYFNTGDKQYIQYQKNIGNKKKKRIKVYAPTIKECFALMQEKELAYLEQEKNSGGYSEKYVDNAILQESMKVWLYTFKKQDLEKNKSFDTIESSFNTHIKDTFLGRTFVREIRAIDLKRHLNELIEKRSVSTTKKVYSLLNQFFEYYYAEDYSKNPMNTVKMPIKKKEISIRNLGEGDIFDDKQPVLTDEEIERLSEELSKPPRSGVVGYTHGYALLFIMWSFMRLGEALGLQWKDVDFEEQTVKIYKAYSKVKIRNDKGEPTGTFEWVLTPPKSKSSIRKEKVYEKAIDCLKFYKNVTKRNPKPDDFILVSEKNNPLSAQYLNTVLKNALKRCGISTKISVHGLRHTGISYFIRHGIPNDVISKLAGHSEVSTTNKFYYGILEEQKSNAFDKLK